MIPKGLRVRLTKRAAEGDPVRVGASEPRAV